jgi:YD repeat-containing protein
MTDENGHTTQSVFDALSRLTSRTLPDGSLKESRLYVCLAIIPSRHVERMIP